LILVVVCPVVNVVPLTKKVWATNASDGVYTGMVLLQVAKFLHQDGPDGAIATRRGSSTVQCAATAAT
jgi:hypothetical protein